MASYKTQKIAMLCFVKYNIKTTDKRVCRIDRHFVILLDEHHAV